MAGLTPEATRIREQIEETRAQVSRTIEELQDRLRPQNIAHQAGEAVREAMESRVHSAVASASDAGRAWPAPRARRRGSSGRR